MSSRTKIEWVKNENGEQGASWNPTRGCQRVSPGCENCYAERAASSMCGPGQPYEGVISRGRWTRELRVVDEKMDEPLRKKAPTAYFVDSMSDLFWEKVDEEVVYRVFKTMALAHWHTFIVLTKRAHRMRELVPLVLERLRKATGAVGWVEPEPGLPTVPPNVWLGVSAENQECFDARMAELAATPAAIRLVSFEPLLGAVDVLPWAHRIDWAIVGGESGDTARPMDPEWARAIRDECVATGVPFFFKQWGEHNAEGRKVGKAYAGRLLDGAEWNEMPMPIARPPTGQAALAI